MNSLLRCLRYDWPLHCVLLFTNWLPDNVLFLRLRGALARHFFGSCGRDLRLGRNLTFYDPQKLHLGNHIYIAYGTWMSGLGEIHIGDEVMLGPYCVITAGAHTMFGGSFRYGRAPAKPIRIGAGTWIAAHVVIADGAQVGKGCLIAANAVVTDQLIPDNSLGGGTPARVIRPIQVDH